MRRWVVSKTVASVDHERLQLIVIHPEVDDKVAVKKEHRGRFYERHLIIGNRNPFSSVVNIEGNRQGEHA
ncbi:hypothetical protein ACFFJY_09180 [Fictibacillus aquaticus]|uniref:Uncharacterized protein n=1 Tax=Fictibacillus aquaticus TaxID=2021314 RepID=A0A235FAU2_9BACL|nr:hypothetical protein [Fictibacillus aquaticus]OYD58450.1 hypothetical protein CGZ90_00685 [Fictibacillus aquaticus]